MPGSTWSALDIAPQPNYPFEFFQMDALESLRRIVQAVDGGADPHWDAIHASPPCQAYSRAQRIQGNTHPDLIGPTRELLDKTGLPYVIENVPGAPLINPIVIEGQLFADLRTSRPRLFETNWPCQQPMLPPRPRHAKMGRLPNPNEYMHVVGNYAGAEQARLAMGIDWMTRSELAEAIPPAYTEFIGAQLLAHIGAEAAA